MSEFPGDIFTEPTNVDPDTLANLGPLRRLAGIWEGTKGRNIAPNVTGASNDSFVERIEMQPIDPQTNGPQLYYGLRYEILATRPGERGTFHHQLGYWLWEPAAGMLVQTLAVPRAQVAMAVGRATPDARRFEATAARGAPTYGICSAPFLEHAFRTDSYRIEITLNDDGTWSYDEEMVMMVLGRPEPFRHIDSNTLRKIAEPTRNPLMR
jgi:hypothetical protein